MPRYDTSLFVIPVWILSRQSIMMFPKYKSFLYLSDLIKKIFRYNNLDWSKEPMTFR